MFSVQPKIPDSSSGRSPRRKNGSKIMSNDLPQLPPEIEMLKQQALSGEDISKWNPSLYPQMIQVLKQHRVFLISYGMYKESEDVDKIIEKISRFHESSVKINAVKNQQNKYKSRLSKARKELEQLNEMSERHIKVMEERFETQKNKLLLKQEEEIKVYNDEWDTPAKQRLYNRASAHLRSLRSQTIQLLSSHRYEEMRVVEGQARFLETQETEKNHRLMETDYNTGLSQLKKKHEEEMKILVDDQKMKMQKYNAAKDFDLSVLKTKITKLETNLENPQNVPKSCLVAPPPPKSIHVTLSKSNFKNDLDKTSINSLKLPPLREDSPAIRRRREKLKEMLELNTSEFQVFTRPKTARVEKDTVKWEPYDYPSQPLNSSLLSSR